MKLLFGRKILIPRHEPLESLMGLDTSQKKTADELFVGKQGDTHRFHQRIVPLSTPDGKRKMHEAVASLVVNNLPTHEHVKFACLPGKFWRFEFQLDVELRNHKKNAKFTGFERDSNVILSGAQYVPHDRNGPLPRVPGYRTMEALGMMYFKTNKARWLNIDINLALSIRKEFFKAAAKTPLDYRLVFARKFGMWDAAWFDYYSPCTQAVGDALSNLHWHMEPIGRSFPVAITVMKCRGKGIAGSKVQSWLEAKLGGGGVFPGIRFETSDYFEYSDSGATMSNILGRIIRE